MDQYQYIRTAYRVYGISVRQIARETGHDRKTIRKVLRGEPSGYGQRHSQPYPVLGPYLDLIDSWLEGDKEAPRKQRHTGTRIYHRLVSEEGFAGGGHSSVVSSLCRNTPRKHSHFLRVWERPRSWRPGQPVRRRPG